MMDFIGDSKCQPPQSQVREKTLQDCKPGKHKLSFHDLLNVCIPEILLVGIVLRARFRDDAAQVKGVSLEMPQEKGRDISCGLICVHKHIGSCRGPLRSQGMYQNTLKAAHHRHLLKLWCIPGDDMRRFFVRYRFLKKGG